MILKSTVKLHDHPKNFRSAVRIGMFLSAAQKIQNDMTDYESKSDHKVATDKYFIVKIECLNDSVDLTEFVKKDLRAKNLLRTSIICGYVYYNVAYILYSSVDVADVHFLNGSHQELCSHYASNSAMYNHSQTRCSLVEFDSRTKVLIYFQTKIYENMKTSLTYHSDGFVTATEATNLSFQEAIDKFNSGVNIGTTTSVEWENLEPYERYGSFYKLVNTPISTSAGADKKFVILSEPFDSHGLNKYTSYLFS